MKWSNRRWQLFRSAVDRTRTPGRARILRIEFLYERINPAAGVLDPSFDLDGRVHIANDNARLVGGRLEIQPNGKIVVAFELRENSTAAHVGFGVARFNVDGSLDASFNTTGIASVQNSSLALNFVAQDIALQSDGSIILAGVENALDALSAVRFSGTGQFDNNFGESGIAQIATNSDDATVRVAVQADDSIVISGNSVPVVVAGPGPAAPAPLPRFAVVRFKANGAPDTTFNVDGLVTTAFLDGNNELPATATAIAIQPDGAIVVAGEASEDLALARFTPAGNLDGNFGTNGRVRTNIGFRPNSDIRTSETALALVLCHVQKFGLV